MNLDAALGWMIIGQINTEFHHPDDEVDDDPLGGCCIINCGPCMALHWLRHNKPNAVDGYIRATGYREGWCFWDEANDTLRWDILEAHWARHKSCGMSNGVLTGCDLSNMQVVAS